MNDFCDNRDRFNESYTYNRGNHEKGSYKRRDDFKLNVDILIFYRDLGTDDMYWLSEVNRFFDYMKIFANKNVKFVAYRLKSRVWSWWNRLQDKHRREGKIRIISWKMQKKLKARSYTTTTSNNFFISTTWVHMGQRSINEYTTEFLRLAERNHLNKTNGQ